MEVLKKTAKRKLDPNDDGCYDEAELRRLGLYDQHKQCVVNRMPPAEEPEIYFFGAGEMLLELNGGMVFLGREDVVSLYTFLHSKRIERLMLNVLRASLIEAGHGELMDEMFQMFASFTPTDRQLAIKAFEGMIDAAPMKGAAA